MWPRLLPTPVVSALNIPCYPLSLSPSPGGPGSHGGNITSVQVHSLQRVCVLVSDGPRAYFSPLAAKPASLAPPQYTLYLVLLTTQGASQNIQSVVSCDTDNNQQHLRNGEV